MRVAVVGSRGFRRLAWVRELVGRLPEGTTVVSGGARGVDRTAETEARRLGIAVESIAADRSRGRGAGPARNSAIVARADYVVAFWDGSSRGTADTVMKAEAAGKPVAVVRPTLGGARCVAEALDGIHALLAAGVGERA